MAEYNQDKFLQKRKFFIERRLMSTRGIKKLRIRNKIEFKP
jgi:hypothetical protein